MISLDDSNGAERAVAGGAAAAVPDDFGDPRDGTAGAFAMFNRRRIVATT